MSLKELNLKKGLEFRKLNPSFPVPYSLVFISVKWEAGLMLSLWVLSTQGKHQTSTIRIDGWAHSRESESVGVRWYTLLGDVDAAGPGPYRKDCVFHLVLPYTAQFSAIQSWEQRHQMRCPVWIRGAEQCPPDSWARDYPGVGRYGWDRWGSGQQGYMGVLMSPELTFRAMSSLWFCMLLNPLSLMSFILICGKINAWKVLEKPSNCPYLPPGDTWYWFSLWKWFTGLLKPGKDQMLWASWSHLPSLLSANTRGGNWEIIDQRSFFCGMLTHRPKIQENHFIGTQGS